MNEKQENANYSLDDIKRFLNGMQQVVGQAEREHKDWEDALRENKRLTSLLVHFKSELSLTKENHQMDKTRLAQLEKENDRLQSEIKNIKNKYLIVDPRKVMRDGDTVLDVLLQAYKELDIEAMKQFEVAFSQLNDDADHRFQKQLDCFRKVRREKAKEKKQPSVMNIDNRGGYTFLDSELKDTKFY